MIIAGLKNELAVLYTILKLEIDFIKTKKDDLKKLNRFHFQEMKRYEEEAKYHKNIEKKLLLEKELLEKSSAKP